MKIIILLGAPGSGKGTVAGRLAVADSKLRHVSSGDLLRDVVKRQTAIGIEAEGYMKRGALVPDQLIAQMIMDLVSSAVGTNTLILDGFPRTVVQAEILNEMVKQYGATLSSVVLLKTTDEVLVERIAGRRSCPACGAGYHVKTIPPRIADVCDVCGTVLVIRKDDHPETVKNRLLVYATQTVPLIDFYRARGLLHEVDAIGSIDDIVECVRHVMA